MAPNKIKYICDDVTLYFCSRFLSCAEKRWHLLFAIWPGPSVLSLCRVPSNCALVFHMTYSRCFTPRPFLGLPFPESPSHPGSVLCLLSHAPFVTTVLELHGLTCLLSPLCPSCAWSASVGELLKDTFLPSCLFSRVSALPRTQNRIALFFTFLTSPRTVSMTS